MGRTAAVGGEPLRHGQRWTKGEDAILLSGLPPHEAHFILRRTAKACRDRRRRLGMEAERRWDIPISEGYATRLRQENALNWAAWFDRKRDGALRSANARGHAYQDATSPAAMASGRPWSEEEYAVLLQDRPLVEIALELGRTYRACSQARLRRLKALGLRAVRTKTETDPYNGADNRMKLEER